MSQRYIGGVVTETTNVAQSPWTGEWTQQAALQGFAGAQAPLKIANSLRFRSSASAYLSRTPSVAGNQQKFTWSGWLKKGAITVAENIFTAGATSSNRFHIGYDASVASGGNGDYLCCFVVLSGVVTNIFQTSALFRDPSSWYHIVLAVDTTQATATNRIALYVNGAQQTFSTYNAPAQNANLIVNSAVAHAIGTYSVSPTIASVLFDGYMGEINFIDGQALPPTAFGTINKENGVWSPSAYTGTYGTNGFRLNFSNGTSTTTLGYDSSGNGNNWTTNNISLTAGSTYDWMIDSPTKYPGSSYGVGNYAVLNPLIQSANTFSNGNLTLTASASTPAKFVSSIGATSGKWYMEFGLSTLSNTPIGISKDTTPRNYLGMSDGSSSVSFWPASGGTPIYVNGSSIAWSGSGTTWTTSDVAGLALDVDASTIALYKNGTLVGSAFSYSSYWTGLTYFAGGNYISGLVYTANFGQRPFAYTPPSGYKSLCTQNLPGVTIQNGAQYMAATTYTGTGSSVSISNAVNGVGFQPDLVWGKLRTTSSYHRLSDSVRGASLTLATNVTDAEVSGNGLVSFDASGFSMNSSTNINQVYPYVAWQWKAGGTAVTNTAGSITSSVSANQTAGFSVVTYTGNGSSGATVGHGLGVAPAFIIIKDRTAARTGDQWPTYHVSIGATGGLVYLNSSGAGIAASVVWNNTNPSSSVFTLGNWGGINYSGDAFVAYCFAAIPGYSAFGSYTGNGSADGPFVYCGFRPAFVLIKGSSFVSNWFIEDQARNGYNVNNGVALRPNLSNAEDGTTTYNLDLLSNGFKLRSSAADSNTSSATFIWAAFASNPFQNALAR